MGNVQQKGKGDRLTKFQREKLKHEFYTFFDLNNDGCLTYKDFLWAKDKICYMSGWKIDSPKYKITEALFHEIWESLEIIADVDKDGKITKKEWLMMWKIYKKELMDKEKEEKDFLKKYYHHSLKRHKGHDQDDEQNDQTSEKKKEVIIQMNGHDEVFEEDDWPVQLDSDEEPPSIVGVQKSKKKDGEEKGTGKASAVDDDQRPGVSQGKSLKEDGEPSIAIDDQTAFEKGDPKKDIADLTILEQFAADKSNFFEETRLPKWLYKYLVFRFNLLDRVGDGLIDHEEFEYVLSEFGVSERTARQAFTIVTENNTRDLDFDYFVSLFEEYYLSDDPSDLGNFINGRLEFPQGETGSDGSGLENDLEDVEDVDPGLVDHRVYSSTSLHSMDDDLHPELNNSSSKKPGDNNSNSSSDSSAGGPLKNLLKKCHHACCIL